MQNIVIEQGKRFTCQTYATKAEVQSFFNHADIENIWKNILTYRQFYDVETDLKNAEGYPYKICLNLDLLSKSYGFQQQLTDDLLKFLSLDDELKKEFTLESKIHSLEHMCLLLQIRANHETLKKICLNEMENISASMYLLKAYSEAIDFSLEKDFSIDNMEKINAILSGENPEEGNDVYRRTETEKDELNPLENIPKEKIQDHIKLLFSFLDQKEIPVVLRALCIPYFFLSVRPFENNNETTAAILAKSFLQKNGFYQIGFSLDIESICFSTTDSFFSRLKQSESSLDLTYFLNRFLAFELSSEEEISSSLKELSIKTISLKKPDNTIYSNDIPVIENVSLALPVFPKENSLEEIEAKARKLREVHPQLKKKQAHFYAGHCQIGLHYTIEQFKNEEKTVYETARTSMEDLANRGYYKKELIGKKFVYTPIPLKEQ